MLLRVKTGCVTCRMRRVKCGEERPECLRCKSTGRKCDGYNRTFISRQKGDASSQRPSQCWGGSLVAIAPSVNADLIDRACDSYCFDFIRSNTVPKMGAPADGEFWRLALQGSTAEPGVKQCLLSLGYLSRSYHLNAFSEMACSVSYNKAVSMTRDLICRASKDEDAFVMLLVTMILLHCIDTARGHYSTAQVHLNSGLKMIAENPKKAPGPCDSAVDELVAAFHRLEFHSMTFSPLAAHLDHPNSSLAMPEGFCLPRRFEKLSEARETAVELAKWVGIFREASMTLSSSDVYIERQRCQAQLDQWKHLFDALCQDSQLDANTRTLHVLVEIFHTCNVLTLHNLLCDLETGWDAYEADFERLAEQISSVRTTLFGGSDDSYLPSFSLEIGVVLPTFLGATKCRSPALRRRFISLLTADRRREGVWDSLGAARIAERVMEIEETMEVPGQVAKSAKDIPEHQRIKRILTDARPGQRKLYMTFKRQSGPNSEWNITKELIRY